MWLLAGHKADTWWMLAFFPPHIGKPLLLLSVPGPRVCAPFQAFLPPDRAPAAPPPRNELPPCSGLTSLPSGIWSCRDWFFPPPKLPLGLHPLLHLPRSVWFQLFMHWPIFLTTHEGEGFEETLTYRREKKKQKPNHVATLGACISQY